MRTPCSGWASVALQLPVLTTVHHVALVLTLLEELLTAACLTRKRNKDEDEEDWVVMRQSGENTTTEAGIQSQDDLELLFAQVVSIFFFGIFNFN